MSTTTETRNESPAPTKEKDLRQEVQELKRQLEVQTATQAGVDATQVATTAGAATRKPTNRGRKSAEPAGRWSPTPADALGGRRSPCGRSPEGTVPLANR